MSEPHLLGAAAGGVAVGVSVHAGSGTTRAPPSRTRRVPRRARTGRAARVRRPASGCAASPSPSRGRTDHERRADERRHHPLDPGLRHGLRRLCQRRDVGVEPRARRISRRAVVGRYRCRRRSCRSSRWPLPGGAQGGVIVATAKTFKQEVIEHDGPVAVQLFAGGPTGARSVQAATKALQGKVKLVVVDATAEQQLAQKYGVRGYPTILIFGDNKRKPAVRGRPRRAQLDLRAEEGCGGWRRSGGGGSAKPTGASGGSAKPSPPSSPKPSPPIPPRRTRSNGVGTFGGKGDPAHRPDVCVGGAALRRVVARRLLRAVVRPPSSSSPTCGAAARRPARLAAVDATKIRALEDLRRERLPEPEGVLQGQAHRPSRLRRAARRAGMVGWALQTLEALGVEAEVPQLLDAAQFAELRREKGALCAIAFLPHILDSGAADREAYLDMGGRQEAPPAVDVPLVRGRRAGGLEARSAASPACRRSPRSATRGASR